MDRVSLGVLFALVVVLAGAYGGYSYWKYARGLLPREGETKARLVANLPAYVKVETLKIQSTDATTFAYQGTMSPHEDLYVSELKQPGPADVSGLPAGLTLPATPLPLTLLKRTSKQGDVMSIYGKILAYKTDDLWHVTDVTVDSGLEQLGRPRSAFVADAVVEGTPEAKAATDKLDQESADYQRTVQNLIAQQSAQTEKTRQEAENAQALADQEASAKLQANRARLDDALKAGTTYRGVLLFSDGQTQEVALSITEQTDLILKAIAYNPSNPGQKQTFTGTVSYDSATDPAACPISFSPVGQQNLPGAWQFYNAPGVVKLRLSAQGLEGTARFDAPNMFSNAASYTIKLEKIDPTAPPPPQNSPPPIATDSPPGQPSPAVLTNSLNDFLKLYWQDNLSNDAAQYAAHFASSVDYCYGGAGKVPRSFVQDDRAKLIQAWPTRTMTQTSLTSDIEGQTAKVALGYRWQYSGARGVRNGTCDLKLGLTWDGTQWIVNSYYEVVGH